MLDLSSVLRRLPFFALPGRYCISEAPLYLSVQFYFSQFSLPALYLSESLIISMKDYAVWLCLAFRSALSFHFLSKEGSHYFLAVVHVFPSPPSAIPNFSPPVSPPSVFPRPRGVKLRAQTPVSQRMHLPGDGGAMQQQASSLAAQRHPQKCD